MILLMTIALLGAGVFTYIFVRTSPTGQPLVASAATTPTPLVVTATPSPTPDVITATPTPPSATSTPSGQGAIISISSEPVSYKNSTVVTVKQGDVATNLYINSSTQIFDATNEKIDKTSLSSGMVINYTGAVVEGGIDTSTIRIL